MSKRNKYPYNIPDIKGGHDPEANAKTLVDRTIAATEKEKVHREAQVVPKSHRASKRHRKAKSQGILIEIATKQGVENLGNNIKKEAYA